MSVVKLTLSMDRSVIRYAKQIAASRHTSVSAMVARMLTSAGGIEGKQRMTLGPITRKAIGMIRLPGAGRDEHLVEDAISAAYRRSK